MQICTSSYYRTHRLAYYTFISNCFFKNCAQDEKKMTGMSLFYSIGFFKKLVNIFWTDIWPLKKKYFLQSEKQHLLNFFLWPLEPFLTLCFKTDAVWQ